MADQENNAIDVADTFPVVLEDNSLDGSHQNPVFSNGVGNVDEKAECENLGVSSCTDEQAMRNGAEQIDVDSTRVLEVDGEVCQSLGVSGCDIEEGIGSISLAGGLQSSELEIRNCDEPIAVECTSIVEMDGKNNISLVSGIGSSVIIEKDDGKSEIKMDGDESESSESESDDPSSSTSASSSSSGSDSEDSSTSGSSSEDEDSEEEGKVTKKIEVEVEEGEIKDSDGHELGADTAASDDEDAGEVSWSGIIGEDDEDGGPLEGPIKSKNEVKVILSIQLFEPTW